MISKYVLQSFLKLILIFGVSVVLTACGGGGGSTSAPTFTIGGTVSGLAGTGLVLQNNGSDDLVITANEGFTFSTALNDLSTYSVTVSTEPSTPSQTCLVSNPTDTLAGANITNVSITCTTNTYTVGGTVSGLSGSGLILQNNGGDDLPIAADGSFAFSTSLNDLSAFAVTASTAPSAPNKSCSITNGSGNLAGADITNVSVICTNTYTIGGTVSGLNGSGLVLQNKGSNDLPITADGNFTFSTSLNDLSTFAVTVSTAPSWPNQNCIVANGSGNLAGENITNVSVICTNSYTIGGTVSGLVGTELILQNNGGDDLSILADRSFAFSIPLNDFSAFAVTVSKEPGAPNQSCNITNASGNIAGANITNVSVECSTILHVSVDDPGATDSSTGTLAEPFLSIKAAIDYANSLSLTSAEVRVAAGNYDVNSLQVTHVIMAEGISLYGGYSSDWSSRDPASTPAIIRDSGNISGIRSTSAVDAGSSITTATVIDGFTIIGGNESLTNAITVDGGSPTISNNIINGGSGTASTTGLRVINGGSPIVSNNTINGGDGGAFSTGIFTGNSSAIITNNTIDAGNGTGDTIGIFIRNFGPTIANNIINGGNGGTQSAGIKTEGASTVIINNAIDGGGLGSDRSYGIYVTGASAPTIRNNTIDGGSGGGSVGIQNSKTDINPATVIDNNIVFTSAGSTSICIREISLVSNPSSVRNNNLFDCPTAIYQDRSSGVSVNLTTITSMEDDLIVEGIATGGNTSDNPKLSSLMRLSFPSPCSVTQGGIDGLTEGWLFTDDNEGNLRTNDGLSTGWSMGAYEFDGTCAP